jgi:hypothetical protein
MSRILSIILLLLTLVTLTYSFNTQQKININNLKYVDVTHFTSNIQLSKSNIFYKLYLENNAKNTYKQKQVLINDFHQNIISTCGASMLFNNVVYREDVRGLQDEITYNITHKQTFVDDVVSYILEKRIISTQNSFYDLLENQEDQKNQETQENIFMPELSKSKININIDLEFEKCIYEVLVSSANKHDIPGDTRLNSGHMFNVFLVNIFLFFAICIFGPGGLMFAILTIFTSVMCYYFI